MEDSAELIVTSGAVGGAFYRVEKILELERDEFPEFLNDTPWKPQKH